MKKIFIAAVAMLLTICAFAQDGKSIYNKYSDKNGVSAVYISPAMFKMMKKLPDVNVDVNDGKVNLGPSVKSLTGMYILNCEVSDLRAAITGDVNKMLSKGNYELLMEAKDDGDVVRMYTSGDDKTIDSFVFLVNEPDESTFICIDGKIAREEAESAISAAVANH